MISHSAILAIVHAIYTTEGSSHTTHPFGIKHHYAHTSPARAAFNTVERFVRNHTNSSLNKVFIRELSNIYCPPSVDKVGHKNWNGNMVKILKL